MDRNFDKCKVLLKFTERQFAKLFVLYAHNAIHNISIYLYHFSTKQEQFIFLLL